MKAGLFLCSLSLVSIAVSAADNPVLKLWSELEAKRAALPAFYQEFAYKQTYIGAAAQQGMAGTLALDIVNGNPRKWREVLSTGSGKFTTIYDGESMVRFDEEGAEHTRAKPRENAFVPRAYQFHNLEWKKAAEKSRQPCGLKNATEHTCVLLEIPLKSGVANAAPNRITMSEGGIAHLFVDLETGLILHRRTVETFNNSRAAYQVDQAFTLSKVGIGMPPNAAALFLPPAESKQVKELSRIDADEIDKKMAGKPAPALTVKDINGKPVALESLKGKVVLLDFWTTWCPPCRADAPALEKLHKRYGSKDLAIVGISVSEERAVVEGYLAKHPKSYPIVLTTENQFPPAYQVRAFPTYIVIERDGNIASASDGDQGFATLKKLLKKAGLETD